MQLNPSDEVIKDQDIFFLQSEFSQARSDTWIFVGTEMLINISLPRFWLFCITF